jgi:hypothetical protein
MRWIFRSLAAFALLFCLYAASPYVALYNLAKAVEAKDIAALNERVNFQAVRQSLSKQIVAAYLRATGKGGQPDASPSPFAGMAAGAGASIIDPLIAPLVTADALINVLENGCLPRSAVLRRASRPALRPQLASSAWIRPGS